MTVRIVVRRNADYPWPWTAWMEHEDGGLWWHRDERGDGDTPDEAVAVLCEDHPQARGVPFRVQADPYHDEPAPQPITGAEG